MGKSGLGVGGGSGLCKGRQGRGGAKEEGGPAEEGLELGRTRRGRSQHREGRTRGRTSAGWWGIQGRSPWKGRAKGRGQFEDRRACVLVRRTS